ncbi:hypothetical protein GJ496_007734 [Pomphorhynchus laevis]|nr:hypothetical protein GJ496_007734 [Pomphorhynchus laevis]
MSMTRRSKRLQDRQNRQQVTNEVQRQQSTMNSGKKRPRMTSKVTSGEDSDWETPKKQVMVSPRHNRQTRYATRRAAMTNMRESITDLHDQSLSNSPARPSATNRIKSTRSASNEPNRQCTTRQLRQRTTRQLSMEGNDTEPSEQFKNLYERVKKRVRRVPRDCYHVSRYEEAQRQNRYNPFASILRNRRTSIPKRRRRSRGCLSWMSPSSTESEEEDSGKEFYEKEACPSKPKVIRTKRATKCTSRDPAPTLFAGDQMNTDFEKIKLDKRITFESVGGHETSIRILKEMIVFPLMYENLFSKFKIRPPRGVLFHGPPGTGKTLLARALANECASGTRKVAFFMRKGADCLSKWVGESERQLKILFEKAYEMRPSIIFFDEIDGLAPVRSSRQDQIHTSVVSTLLALMDGVDSDSGVIIIGATNRLDFIDPALRRPGRFDREFFFGLPKFKVRADILHIHTKDWQRRPTEDQINDLAERTNGFCGADLQALCRDSVLYALRRTYPQVYKTKRRLNIDPDTIHVIQEDFNLVLSIMNSSVARTATMYSLPVPNDLKCLIQSKTYTLCNIITELFPAIVNSSANKNQFSITSHKARVLIAGNPTCGVSTYIAPAILHMLETNVYAIDPLVLYSPAWRSAEEAIANQFRLASQNVPSVIYFPRIESWWSNLGESAQVMLLNALNTLDPRAAVLLVVASDCALEVIPSVIRDLFDQSKSTFLIADPDYSQYSEFISTIFIKEIPSILNTVLAQEIDVIDNCDSEDEIQEKVLSPEELEELWQREEAVMISLRLFLREMLSRFVHDKRFTLFRSPVDPSKVIDYYDIIKQPIDLSLIMSKIDKHNYFTVDQFLADVKLLLRNANMYNPDAVLDGNLMLKLWNVLF